MKSFLIPVFLMQAIFSSPGVTLTPAQKMMPIKTKNLQIAQVSAKGESVTLTNGKKFIVVEEDRAISGGWLLPSKVKLYRTKDRKILILENLTTKAKVRVMN